MLYEGVEDVPIGVGDGLSQEKPPQENPPQES
jgi:hypothetical protein